MVPDPSDGNPQLSSESSSSRSQRPSHLRVPCHDLVDRSWLQADADGWNLAGARCPTIRQPLRQATRNG